MLDVFRKRLHSPGDLSGYDPHLYGLSRANAHCIVGQVSERPCLSRPSSMLLTFIADHRAIEPTLLSALVARRMAIDKLCVPFRFTADEARDPVQHYLSANSNPTNNRCCWPRDCQMKLIKPAVSLGRAVFWNVNRAYLVP